MTEKIKTFFQTYGYVLAMLVGVIVILSALTLGRHTVGPTVRNGAGTVVESVTKPIIEVATSVANKISGNGQTTATKDNIAELQKLFARAKLVVQDKNLSTKAKVDEYHLIRARIEILLNRLEDAKAKVPKEMEADVQRWRIVRQ